MPMSPLSLAILVFTLVVMYFSISLHDLAQAWMANRLGDPTARMAGRMTLNPMAGFDPWGMALWPLLSLFVFHSRLPFGWSQPVPMTYRNFRTKNGEVLSILAGPAAQLVAATVSLIALVVMKHYAAGGQISLQVAFYLGKGAQMDALGQLPGILPVMLLLYLSITMNLLLLALNIIPFPFFDGGRILVLLLPYNAAKAFEQYSMYFMIAFFFLGGPLTLMVFSPMISVFDGLLMSL
jgi:Zn-dependent protease